MDMKDEILHTGVLFNQHFKMIWNPRMGEVQLYWEDGELNASCGNGWQSPQEIADEWLEELQKIDAERQTQTEIINAAIRSSNRWAEYCGHEEITA